MEENKENIDYTKKAIRTYLMDKDRLMDDIERHNEMLAELNKRILRIVEFAPIIYTGKINEDGQPIITGQKFDLSTDEILKQIKSENERTLRSAFPELYLYSDHLNENDGEIDESILND